MKTLTCTFLILGALVYAAVWLATDVEAQEHGQLRRLLAPTDGELRSERQGRIHIYDGLEDIQVERAMDQQYDRIQSMMFIHTVVTDDHGEPRRDEQTGELVVEEDDCD